MLKLHPEGPQSSISLLTFINTFLQHAIFSKVDISSASGPKISLNALCREILPDLLCALNPLKSCQALYHGEENPSSAYTQLC